MVYTQVKKAQPMTHSALTVEHYLEDGFERVCDVRRTWDNKWWYTAIRQDLMYRDHRSWIYFIVVDGTIEKVGETGQPLGIRTSSDEQPRTGTKSRFGRYRSGHETDQWIRQQLWLETGEHRVSLWARACPIVLQKFSVGRSSCLAGTHCHKDLEIAYLDYMWREAGTRPRLNTVRK